MHWRYRSRSIAIGGICLMATLTAGASARAQAMQVVGPGSSSSNPGATGSGTAGFNPYDPQWAMTAPFGFNTTSPGVSQQAYTMKLNSGTVGLFSATSNQDYGARAIGSTGNFFDPLPFSPLAQRGNWFTGLGDSAWQSSFVGYKSNPNDALGGLYTTASFGMTNFKTGPAGLPGLSNFSSGTGNDATAVSATAGIGYQISPNLTIEGSVGFTQMQGPNFH